MSITGIIMGERPPTGVQTPIEYSVLSEDFCTTINGEIVREPVAPLRERFAKLRARDNLLGAVLARLGADPGARESEAHAAVGKLLERNEALEKWNERLSGCLEKLRQKLGLEGADPERLVVQVLAMNTEITSALAKAQEGERVHVAALSAETEARMQAERELHDERLGAEIEHANLKDKLEAEIFDQHEEITDALTCSRLEAEALTEALAKAQEENAWLKAELEASAKALEAANAKRERDFNAAREAQREIEKLKIKLAETDLDRVLAEARVSGLAAELQALEHALRDKIGDLPF